MKSMYSELLRVTIMVGLSSSTVTASNAGSFSKRRRIDEIITYGRQSKRSYINCRAKAGNDGKDAYKSQGQPSAPDRKRPWISVDPRSQFQ
jgi:hypothetical protein